MKKMIFTLMAAWLVGTSVMAQDESKNERSQRKFDKTEMVKHRTDEAVSRYKLSEKQAKQLLELNTKYADMMRPHGMHRHGHHGGAGRPPMPPKDNGKMKERKKNMESTMKVYDAELKKIMTDEQFKCYKADMKKQREKHRESRKMKE